MESLSLPVLYALIAVMIVLSAYFSSSETAMMALNRYRLKHLVKAGQGGAKRADALLKRPDRLLGIILFGNNVVNFFAGTVATLIALRQFGEVGLAVAPFVLTFVFLILAEIGPKTIAAHAPERIAFPSAYILSPMLRLLYPFVWILNTSANAIVRPFIKDAGDGKEEKLSPEELRTVLHEGAHLPLKRRGMLLSILDLEHATVDDIMVPKADIFGIDLEDDSTPSSSSSAPAAIPGCRYTEAASTTWWGCCTCATPAAFCATPSLRRRRSCRKPASPTSCRKTLRCTPSC
jgi:Mg2+/Co2+ transporter CorB